MWAFLKKLWRNSAIFQILWGLMDKSVKNELKMCAFYHSSYLMHKKIVLTLKKREIFNLVNFHVISRQKIPPHEKKCRLVQTICHKNSIFFRKFLNFNNVWNFEKYPPFFQPFMHAKKQLWFLSLRFYYKFEKEFVGEIFWAKIFKPQNLHGKIVKITDTLPNFQNIRKQLNFCSFSSKDFCDFWIFLFSQ